MGPHYSREFKVRYTEMDAYGHVNNAAYLRYMHEAAFDASLASGVPLNHWADLGRAWFIRDSEIEYLKPLTYPDRFTVETWLSARGQAWVQREYRFVRDGETIAQGFSIWAYVDLKTGGPAVADAAALAPLGGIDAIPVGQWEAVLVYTAGTKKHRQYVLVRSFQRTLEAIHAGGHGWRPDGEGS